METTSEFRKIENRLPLVYAIIDALLFLECSGDNEVNPDSAVRCMENIASSLLVLDEKDQIALRLQLEEIAETSSDRGYRDFIRKLPDAIGLANL